MVVLTVVCCQIRVWICVSCVQSLKTYWVNDVVVFALDLTSYNEFAVVASLKSVINVARVSVEYCYACIWYCYDVTHDCIHTERKVPLDT
jgi:hypothetical protein